MLDKTKLKLGKNQGKTEGKSAVKTDCTFLINEINLTKKDKKL